MAAKKSTTKKKAAKKKTLPKESGKPPIDAAESGNLNKVQAYLNGGGDIDAQGVGAWTLLIAAVRNGHGKLAEYLLQAGAKPNVPDFQKKTALHHAAYLGWFEMVELLLGKGADPLAEDSRLCKPLESAASCVRGGKKGKEHGNYKNFPTPQKAKCIHLLLEVGLDPDEAVDSLEVAIDFLDSSGVLEGRQELAEQLKQRLSPGEVSTVLSAKEGAETTTEPSADDLEEERRWEAWIDSSVKALKLARGNEVKVRAAIKAYIAEGVRLECSPTELWDHFCVSTPGLPKQAGYTKREIKRAEEIFEDLAK